MKKHFPHIYFWITALIIILIGEFSHIFLNTALDFNLHDTYYVIATRHLSTTLSILYVLAGLIYWMLKKWNIKLYVVLTKTHTYVTIGVVFLYQTIISYYTFINPPNIFSNDNQQFLIATLIFSALVVQLFFIVNIIFSVIRHLKISKP
ncbi:hypothetical protein [uncultured Psychroserpens sp.]|uniref:hypothetical protein n=1 Tax=uncultured Psychroserpens sp. TaxID=255436 RepID=UPI00261A56EF|nr:hypothetical protein [uncultured Psychroserpens sp.]